jgi:dGTPase
LFTLDDLSQISLIDEILRHIRAAHPQLESPRLIHELIRRLIAHMIEDVILETGRRLHRLAAQSADDVRHCASSVVAFSPAMAAADHAIKGFLYPRMYRQARVMRIMNDAEQVIIDLFSRYDCDPGAMPAEWATGGECSDRLSRVRRIADFIAGMTDRYALVEHARLFDSTPELR